jgi:hypothetical protein
MWLGSDDYTAIAVNTVVTKVLVATAITVNTVATKVLVASVVWFL